MSKYKVLWVSNTIGCGGAQRQMLHMYKILEQRGYDITILYYAKSDVELDATDVKIVFIDKSKYSTLGFAKKVAEYIRTNNFEIMHAFGGGSANMYGRYGAALCKNVVPIGAMLGKKHFKKTSFKITNSILNLFGNWWTVNNTELIPILKHDLCFLNDSKIFMLHNGFAGVETVDYHLNETTEYDVEKNGNFVFTVVGRMQPVKNYPLFLKAAAEIIKDNNNVRFWLIGDGEVLHELKELSGELGINDKVKFWGYRNDIDIALSRSDAFVQTSHTEGSPNTIAEAMRASLPIISTNSTDLSEMIKDGENGYVVQDNDMKGLTEAMTSLLKLNTVELKSWGEKSLELFNNTFYGENVADEFDELYSRVLGRNK